ncbi:BapA/Bap/LapF family large adhesin, partial [Acinetobacter sp. YH12239]|uniref:BapA/Bap/LapF family large adhesin n=1 Tax=Acinetobacter sp. YH12239 TaxID=2601166 RepID=UPI0015D3A520
INEALQLVADGRDPAKTVTKGDVIKATDELDAADAALKTNAQQQAEDTEKSLAESIGNLEKLVEQAEQKIAENETARDKYTENSLSELTKEIADAKAVIAQYKDPNQPNPSLEGSVLPAQKELQSAIDSLVAVVEILAVDNDVNLLAVIEPSVISYIKLVDGKPVLNTDKDQLLQDTGFNGESAVGFGVAKVGIGGAADISALDFGQYLSFNIKENTTADILLKGNSGGISIGNSFDLLVLKEVAPNVWKVDQLHSDWLKVILLGGTTTGSITLDEGNYRVLVQSNSGIAVLSGNSLAVQEMTVYDSNNPVKIEGEISGNILTDVNQAEGQSGHDMYFLNTEIAVKPQDSTSQFVDLGQNGTKEFIGQYGKLTVKFDGSYTYIIDSSKNPSIGAVDTFIYQLKDPVTGMTSEAKLNITINNTEVDHTVIDESFVVDLAPTEQPIPESEVLSKVNQVIVASVGLGIASVDVANFKDAIEINVGESQLREVSFKAAGGAPVGLGAIPVSLEIYKLNEDTGLWELYSKTPDWFTIVGVVVAGGASSKNVDVVLEPGQYKAITTGNTIGIAVLPTITLTPVSDKIISYDSVAEGQTINGDVTIENLEDFVVIKVDGLSTSQDSEVQGKFGKLTVNPDGTYVYTLNKDVKVSQLDVETFSIHLKNPQTGELATTTLNIRLDSFISNDDINDVINVESEISKRNYSEDLGATSGSSVSKAFKVEGTKSGDVVYHEKDLTADVTFTVKTTLAINGDGRKMTYIVKDKAGNPVASGDVEVSKSTTNTIKVNNLPAGSYTLELNVTGSSYFTGSVKMEQVITEYLPTDPQSLEPVTGNIFDNDLGSDTVTSIQVQNQTAYTKFGNDKITIQGEHGVLEIDHTGKYTYTPSKNSFGEDKFTYVTTSVTGSQDTAELVFGYTQTINGDENPNVVSSGGLNDTFNLGSGADKLIFNLLDDADATGGNGFDTWSDFEAGVDVIDVSQLFVDANTSTTFSTDSTDQVADILSKYITVKDSVISIDRDGEGTQFEATQLLNIGPQNVDLTLEQLLQNGQIIY